VIKLAKKNLGGTISSGNGGDVTLVNGTRISLPANSIIKASDNSNYTGTVNVYASYIDPTGADIFYTVPGSLMANDKDGKRVFLNSFGMMAVELESSAGEKLQIKSGNEAILTCNQRHQPQLLYGMWMKPQDFGKKKERQQNRAIITLAP
jgi:hypothetical protein